MATVMIAAGYFDSVTGLQPNEQAKANEFVMKFSANPSHPGLSLERVKKGGDDVWAGRITQELRAILFKDGDTWAILHAGHHDAAYAWAERRRIGRHHVTGALEVVDVTHAVEQAAVIAAQPVTGSSRPRLLGAHEDEYLLSLGVPEEWLPAVREIRHEDQLLDVCVGLPADVSERLLDVASGKIVTPPTPVRPDVPVAAAPDTQRRFFVVQDLDGLTAALEAPLHRWIAFLHPSQKAVVEGDFNGPVKVTGSAGTGKTVVALHRARRLAREGQRVLLTSFVTTLCENLEGALGLLCVPEVRSRIRVSSVHALALELVRSVEPQAHPAGAERVRSGLEDAARVSGSRFDLPFIETEWERVVQRQDIATWDEYRGARRLGRGVPLSVKDRKSLWAVFAGARDRLSSSQAYSWPDLCARARSLLEGGKIESPFDAVIVDEVQDLGAAELRFLAALSAANPERLMLVGDAGQRIYPGGFSLRALGIEVRGRSYSLRINYRTTEQIRRHADRILGDSADDMDGGSESRSGTRSLLRGPEPELISSPSEVEELNAITDAARSFEASGLKRGDIAVFARTNQLAEQIRAHLQAAGVNAVLLKKDQSFDEDGVRVGSMHRAKGLEFKAVVVAGCSADLLPHPRAVGGPMEEQDRSEAVDGERRLLYVAMTRARDEVVLTWHGAPSPFLEPLLQEAPSENP